MALRDTWHRTLVYFGLAEEDDYPTEERPLPEPEEELEDRYRERPNVRRLERKRGRRDDFDDIFADDAAPTRSRTTTLRPVSGGGNGRGGGAPVPLGISKSLKDAPQNAGQVQDAGPGVL